MAIVLCVEAWKLCLFYVSTCMVVIVMLVLLRRPYSRVLNVQEFSYNVLWTYSPLNSPDIFPPNLQFSSFLTKSSFCFPVSLEIRSCVVCVVNLPEVISLKKTDSFSPSSYSVSIASWWASCPPSCLCAGIFVSLVLSRSLWAHMCICSVVLENSFFDVTDDFQLWESPHPF